MDNLKLQGLKALTWDFFGKIARYGTTFIVTIFLARILEPSDFGLIAMVMVIVMVAMIFTDVGLGGALIQRRRVLPVHYASVFYFNMFIGGLLTLTTFFSAAWISDLPSAVCRPVNYAKN
jgi:O-antigen/teichoic acid export membrane protein